jgi:lipopolysaccharide transport system permease protein
MFRDLYKYRNFIIQSVRNDLISRFARSKLGGLWAILNPLSQVLIYALILSNVLAAKLPGVDSQYAYAIYLMAGLLGWTLFNEIVGRCLNIFIEHGNLIKKMSFPRVTLPAIAVGSCLINNLFLFISMLGIFALLGHQFNMAMLWLIPLSLVVIVFSLGIGLILGVMNVFLRDIGQVIPIILQMLFWFTPIVYPITIIPEAYRHWLNLNPMYPIIDAYQQILVYGNSPQWGGVLIILAVGIILSIVGLFMFRRSSAEMVDAL